jgi:integrase
MGRRPLELGTFGEIYKSALVDGRWCPLHAVPEGYEPQKYKASARYRPADGHTKQMEREGTTLNKAVTNLKKALAERLGHKAGKLTATTRLDALAEQFLVAVKRKRVGTTYDRYKSRIKNHIKPAVGGLMIREATAARLKGIFDEMETAGLSANTRRGIRTVLSGMMQLAVYEELIAANPVASLERIESDRPTRVVAYTGNVLIDFFARVDGDTQAARSDLPDLLRFLFGMAPRIGEVLAVRWCDINFTDEPIIMTDDDGDQVEVPPHSIWFNGNIVAVSGVGLVRHSGKTFSSSGVVAMPDYIEMMLLVRRPATAALTDPVFPSEVGGWRHPSNTQRAVRRLRARIGYPKFTTHIGRKSVATELDKAGYSARAIADVLRHRKPSMTQDRYMAAGGANPAAAAALDRLHKTA